MWHTPGRRWRHECLGGSTWKAARCPGSCTTAADRVKQQCGQDQPCQVFRMCQSLSSVILVWVPLSACWCIQCTRCLTWRKHAFILNNKWIGGRIGIRLQVKSVSLEEMRNLSLVSLSISDADGISAASGYLIIMLYCHLSQRLERGWTCFTDYKHMPRCVTLPISEMGIRTPTSHSNGEEIFLSRDHPPWRRGWGLSQFTTWIMANIWEKLLRARPIHPTVRGLEPFFRISYQLWK